MKKYLKLMRITHYLKNILIFIPIVFAKELFTFHPLTEVCFAFITFCLASSIVYIINDLNDIENDRKHPVKCKRPLASGEVTVKNAKILIALLALGVICFNSLADGTNFLSWGLLLTYIVLNIFYSKGLKNVPLLDVMILVSGYVIRVLYGAIVVNIDISSWLYLTIISVSFFFGFGKRRNEILKQEENSSRKVLKFYTENFLDKSLYMFLTLTIVFYSLWCVDANTIAHLSGSTISWTVLLIIPIFLKYTLDIEKDSFGDPVDVVLGDKVLLGLISFYAIIMIMIIYVNPLIHQIAPI